MNRLTSRCRFQVSLAAAVMFLMTPGLARAQSQFGSIAGHVTDASQAVVPGVTVRATNEATNVGYSTHTGTSGSYEINGLNPGNYTVSANTTGFKELRLTGVVVIAGQATGTDLHLEVGKAQEQITVTASAAQLNTESGSVATGAPSKTIEMPATLPQLTQSYAETLVPYLEGQEYVGGRNVAAYGSRSYDRRVDIDGTIYGLQTTSPLREPPGSIDEVQVTSIAADADHQTSNTVEMVSTKGTNYLHGFIWDQIQNQAFTSRVWYTPPSAPHPPGTPSNTYGFAVGGPVFIPKLYNGRNKTFFHMTFDKSTLSEPSVGADSIPSAQMFNGDFSQLLPGTQLINPYTGAPFPNNQINSTTCVSPCQISPIGKNILNLFNPATQPTLQYVTNQFIANNALAPGVYMQPFHALFIRGDEQIGAKDNIHGVFGYSNQLITEANSGIPSAGLDLVGYESKYIDVAENHIFSPTVLNEVTFGWKSGNRQTVTNTGNAAGITTSLGLPQPSVAPPAEGVTGGPNISAGILSFSPEPLGAGVSLPYTVTFRDTLSWIHGRYTFKGGFELIRYTGSSTSFANLYGTYNFSGQFTGNPMTDVLLGLLSSTSSTQYPGPIVHYQRDLGYFGSVDARLTKKLTLSAGLRVTDNTPVISPTGAYYNFNRSNGDLVLANQAAFSKLNPGLSPAILANIQTASAAGFPNELLNPQHLFAPRLGFAYHFRDNTVVRGGAGVYGTLLNNGGTTGGPFTAGNLSFTGAKGCTGLGGTPPCTPTLTLANPFPGGVAAVNSLSVAGLNPTMRVPVMYQWNLTVEQKLRGDFVLRLSYTGNETDQLPTRGNIDLPFASTTAYSSSSLRYPQWNSVVYADSGGNTSYNSLDVAVTRRWNHGVTLDGGYQLEKCLTDSDEGGLESNYGSWGSLGITSEDPYNRNRDKGNCESIPRHKFRMMYTANLPVGKGRDFLNDPRGLAAGALDKVVGGWTYSGMFIATTGHYFTPLWIGSNFTNTSQGTLRPDRVCSGKAATQTWDHLFEPSCFVLPPTGRYGNAGTGIIEGLGYWRYDNGIYKEFAISHDERMPRLRLTMNSMNIFNHPTKSISSASPFYINSPSTVNRANDIVYDSGLTANLGAARIFYLEARILW